MKGTKFNFPEDTINFIDTLMEKTKLKSRGDVIKYALSSLNVLMDEIAKGNKIYVLDKDGNKTEIIADFKH